MRKSLVLLILSLLLLCTIPAMAAGGGQATVTSAGGVVPGAQITFMVTITDAEPIRAAMLEPTYNSAAFELVSGKFSQTGTLTDFSDGIGVIAWSEPTDPSGLILTFTLKAKPDIQVGNTYTVGCQYSVRDANDELQYCSVVSSTVTVTCNHSFTAKRTQPEYLCGPATCTAPEKYYFSCESCGAAGSEIFENGKPEGHDFSGRSTELRYAKTAATCQQSGEYYYSCTGCGLADTKTFLTEAPGDHTYDHSCDTDCNTCGQTRTTTHDYQWKTDAAQHWQECTGCQDRQPAQDHTPGPAATQTTPQKCTQCGMQLAPALAHVHEYPETYTFDAYAHWHECQCGNEEAMNVHTWSEPAILQQPTADATGIRRTVCTVCGMEQDEELPKITDPSRIPQADQGSGLQILLWCLLGISLAANLALAYFLFRKSLRKPQA